MTADLSVRAEFDCVRAQALTRLAVARRPLPEREREAYRCRQTKAALTTKFQTVPITAPPRPAIHHTLS